MSPATHSAARAASVSLDRAPCSQPVRVVEVEGGREITRLLGQLQVRVGAVLRVVRAAPLRGPLLVECHGSTVIIGRRLAEHVRVEALQ